MTHYSLLQNFELHLLTSKFWASSAQFCLFRVFELHLSEFKFRSAQFHLIMLWVELHKLSFVCLIGFGFAELNL